MDLLTQNQNLIYVIYCGIALGVLLIFSGAAHLMGRKENRSEAKSRRMHMIAQGRSTAELLALLKKPDHKGPLTRLPFVGDLPKQLRRSGLLIKPSYFLGLCGALVFAIFVGLSSVIGALGGICAAVTLGLVLPIAAVRIKCRQNTQALVHQLPDALDMMARGLKVGHPLNTSIAAVAREMPDPIGTEFGVVYDQVNYGDDLPEAFHDFAERVDLEDVRYLSASIGIQHGTGGDLATVVETLSRVIRDRIAMRRKIRAISSEGRLSAWFLSSLPIVIFGFTSFSSPDYYGGVANDPLFIPMAVTVVVLTILNLLVLKKLVEFRI